MRLGLALAIALAALGACSKSNQAASGGALNAASSAPASASASSAPPGAAAGAPAGAPSWVRDQWASLPDWNTVANISDGGKLMFAPRSIVRDLSAGTADVKVQVLHASPIPYAQETATTVETTWYFKEHATYRFRCEARTYVVIERQYLGVADAVIGTDHANPHTEADWRPIDDSGPARVLEGPVCKAA